MNFNYNKIFNFKETLKNDDLKFFVKNGYVVYRDLYNKSEFGKAKQFLLNKYSILKKKFNSKKNKIDSWKLAAEISENFENSNISINMYKSGKLLDILKKYLGPDICVFNKKCSYIVDPVFKNYSTKLNPHVDGWVGNSVEMLQVNTFITKADKFNSMIFYPGSHLFGLLPVKNRELDKKIKLNIKPIALDKIQEGDVLIFHPLILHGTKISNNNQNFRFSVGDRFKSFEKQLTSQESSLGYKVLCAGPINHIKRIIGNDYLLPFRVLGGKAGISAINKDIYDYLD